MRAFVFTDPALTRQAGRFVWLALDSEKAKNAAERKRLKIDALPSFYVVDPARDSLALTWVGGATVAQLQGFLDEGATRVSGVAPAAGWQQALADADRLYSQTHYADAAAAYHAALADAPSGFNGETRAVESLLFSWQMADSNAAIAQYVAGIAPRWRHDPAAGTIVGSGVDAAASMAKDDPRRAALLESLEPLGREIAADRALVMPADDRSGLYIALLDARDAEADTAGHRRVASEWATFLEGEAAKAKTPDERAVFDSHRLSAYLELGQPERAIPMLEASQRDLPNDYNPPQRLATAYKAMKRWKEALAASDRAMGLSYGPRRMLVLQTRADIYAGMGDSAMQKKTLEQALAEEKAFPDGQRSANTIASLEKKIAALNAPSAAAPTTH